MKTNKASRWRKRLHEAGNRRLKAEIESTLLEVEEEASKPHAEADRAAMLWASETVRTALAGLSGNDNPEAVNPVLRELLRASEKLAAVPALRAFTGHSVNYFFEVGVSVGMVIQANAESIRRTQKSICPGALAPRLRQLALGHPDLSPSRLNALLKIDTGRDLEEREARRIVSRARKAQSKD